MRRDAYFTGIVMKRKFTDGYIEDYSVEELLEYTEQCLRGKALSRKELFKYKKLIKELEETLSICYDPHK